MIKAVIFDMDGVIFDTEKLLLKCWKQASKVYNIDLKDEQIAKFRGTTAKMGKEIFEKMYPEIDFFQIRNEREKLKNQYIAENGMPIKDGIEDFLKLIKEKELKIALATSTKQEITMRYLIEANLAKYFDFIICGDMVKNGKPEPDIYIEVCESLKMKPEETIVFEDSKNGILSASKAGCNVVMVIDIDEFYEETENLLIGKVKNYTEAENFLNIERLKNYE